MNQVLDQLLNRHSVRAYEDRPIGAEEREQIIAATMRAPTAGNMMLYSVIEVSTQSAKDILAVSCDNQPFIAKAPLVLLFLADYQRWYDYFEHSNVGELSTREGSNIRKPKEGDLMLACCDALIAAQSAVVAADSLGIGSCYIGDIMENYEQHKELFRLPGYTFPIALICFGYPTKHQSERALLPRFATEYIVFKDRYRRLSAAEFDAMFRERQESNFATRKEIDGARNVGQLLYRRKFNAAFMHELNPSVRLMLGNWSEEK